MAGSITYLGASTVGNTVQRVGTRTYSIHYQVALHAAAIASVYLIDFAFDSPTLTLMAGGMVIMLAYAGLGALEFQRAPLGLSPLSFYFFWYAVGLGASAIYIGNLLAFDQAIPFAGFQVWSTNVRTAYLIYLVGSLLTHVGIQLSRPSDTAESEAVRLDDDTLALAPIMLCYLAGVAFLLWPERFAKFGSVASPLSFAALSALCALALCGPESLRVPNGLFAALLSLGTLGLFIGSLNTGSKARIMFSLLPVFWLFAMRRSLRRWLPVVVVGSVLLYSVVQQAVNLSRMLPFDRSKDAITRISEAYGQLASGQAAENGSVDQSPSEQVKQFLYRQFDPGPVGFLVEEVKARGLMHGETMAYGLYAWIPRLLWPGKPNVTRGAWFAAYLGQAPDASVATTSTGETAIGELYWNFGMPGVIGGMLIIGMLIGLLWRMAGTDPHRAIGHMLLYMLLMLEMPDQPQAVTTTMGLIANLIIFGTSFAATNTLRVLVSSKARGVKT